MDDSSPEAYEKLVDRLLDADAYAERMAMEWMDVARYADSHDYIQMDGVLCILGETGSSTHLRKIFLR